MKRVIKFTAKPQSAKPTVVNGGSSRITAPISSNTQ